MGRMSAPAPLDKDGGPLEDVIAGYLSALDAGEKPDREALLSRHPEMAGELREFFENHDRIRGLEGLEAQPAPRPALAPGTCVGDHELLEELGRGGMGIVYRARHHKLGREVALKMVLGGRFASGRDRE